MTIDGFFLVEGFFIIQDRTDVRDTRIPIYVCLFISIEITIKIIEYALNFQIFHGRQSYRELYEFTEDLLGHTRNLSLHPHDFGRRAAAFYLLYTLYFKQPCRPKVRIRVEYYQYEDFCHWMDELRAGCHWELVFCWAKLVSDNAFVFVGSTKPVGLENSGRNQDRYLRYKDIFAILSETFQMR